MKSFLNWVVFLLVSVHLHSTPWFPSTPAQISASTSTSWVTSSPSPISGQFLATYPGTSAPLYSIYNEGTQTWSSVVSLPGTYNSGPIFSSLGSGLSLITSIDNPSNTGAAQYVTFDGVTMSSIAPIPNGVKVPSQGSFIYPSFNTLGGLFMVTWLDGTSSPNLPYYITFNGSSWTPAAATSIPGATLQSGPYIYSTANTQNGEFFITWKAVGGSAYYYIGTPLLSSSGALGTAQVIPNSSMAGFQVFPSFDPNSGHYVVTWVDQTSSLPMFTVFNGFSWTVPEVIPGTGVANLSGAIYSSLDPSDGLLLYTWTGASDAIYYATYDSNVLLRWSAPSIIPNSMLSISPIFSSFDAVNRMFMVTWRDQTSNLPTYDTFSLILPTTTTVTTSPNPSTWLQNVLIRAVVSSSSGTPTGTVTFFLNGVRIGRVPLGPSGVATWTINISCAGGSTIEAFYSGDVNFLGSSGSTIQTVECLEF